MKNMTIETPVVLNATELVAQGYVSTLTHSIYLLAKEIDEQTDIETLYASTPFLQRPLNFEELKFSIIDNGFKIATKKFSHRLLKQTPTCIEFANGSSLVVLEANSLYYKIVNTEDRNRQAHVSVGDINSLHPKRLHILSFTTDTIQSKFNISKRKSHWFWGQIFLKRIRVFEIILASFFANLIAVSVSLFALQVYDRVLPGQSEATLWVLVIGAMIGILFESLLRISRSKLVDKIGKEAELEITKRLMHKFLGLRFDRQPGSPSELVHMMREFSSVREFFSTASIGVVADIPFVVIFLFLIYTIAGPVVWVIIIGAILTVIPSLFFQPKMAQLSKETMGGMSAGSRILTEAAYNFEAIKLSQAHTRFQRLWEEITLLNTVKTTDQRILSSYSTYWASGMQQLTYVFAVVCGVYMVFDGQFTLGSIIAVSILSTRTLSPITQLSGLIARWQNMSAALGALESIVNSEQEYDGSRTYLRRHKLRGDIQLNNVQLAYPNAEHAAAQVDKLNISANERVVILGENGSGKSTLLRALSGLHAPNQGEILLDGLDHRQIHPQDVRNCVGLLPQEVRLFKGTIRENLVFGQNHTSDDHLLKALSFSGLMDFVKHQPKGLDLAIMDGGAGLSVGQRQSIGLARIFIQDPQIVLLDEPTASLDRKLEAEIIVRLNDWLKQKTVVIATHRMLILDIATRILVMRNGRILMDGPKQKVLDQLSGGRKDQ